jgi:hypothetical protein
MDGAADAGLDAGLDAAPGDAAVDADAFIGDPCTDECGPVELCGDMGDGDGLDNNCDGTVDEECPCVHGSARACFAGPPNRRNVGVCADGAMHCSEFERWGPCMGGQQPADEICDGADNDCDGFMDDGLAGCASTFTCPGADTTIPLTDYGLDGRAIYGGAVTSWSWTVICPPTVPTCPVPDDPSAEATSVYFVASGSYRVRVVVVTAEGETITCEWIVNVGGNGLRVELNWDTQGIGRGDTDVDLHLHRRSVPAGVMSGETPFFNSDDCFFLNCKATTYDYDMMALRARWMLPDTADLSVCRDAPQGEGGFWESFRGACYNPRLDVDVISCDPAVTDPRGAFCAPENINIDNPPLGDTYRVMVNYYSQHEYTGGATHPAVNIYCNGLLRGSFGSDPFVTLRIGDRLPRTNDSWLVADVMFYEDSCGRVDCRVAPLGMITNDGDFGPDWSF